MVWNIFVHCCSQFPRCVAYRCFFLSAERTVKGVTKVLWDEHIAEVAQNYADQCIWGHNSNRNSQFAAVLSRYGLPSASLGENIAAGYPSRTSTSAMDGWNSEEADWSCASNTCAGGAQCGHYTQVTWSSTTHIGCGIRQCTTGSPFGGTGQWTNIVCDYCK